MALSRPCWLLDSMLIAGGKAKISRYPAQRTVCDKGEVQGKYLMLKTDERQEVGAGKAQLQVSKGKVKAYGLQRAFGADMMTMVPPGKNKHAGGKRKRIRRKAH